MTVDNVTRGQVVLAVGETTGTVFKSKGGPYAIIVSDYVADITLQLQNPTTADWEASDVVFTGDGILQFTLPFGLHARLNTGSAGATAVINPARSLA